MIERAAGIRSRARLLVLAAVLGLACVAAAVASGAATGTIAGDLNNPRGIAVAGDRLLVVESATGAIDALRNGGKETIATVPGAVDVAAASDGTTYAVVGGPPPDAPPPPPGTLVSSLVRLGPGGSFQVVADIGAFQKTDPDPDDLDSPPNPTESNPNGLAILPDGRILVADAANNDLLLVGRHGQITRVARFRPERVHWNLPFHPPTPPPVPAEAVPTAVAVGPDGAYYVSELTGFPFTKGAARIWRIKPGSVGAVCDPAVTDPTGQCQSVATGFSSVIDLAFAPDGGLYVLEIARDGLAGALVLGTEFPPIGDLWSIKNGVKTKVADSLVAPGGVAVNRQGVVFVTTVTFGPPGGTVTSLG